MGWLSKLLGFDKPERRSDLKTGFFWRASDCPALAAGRGFNQQVVGESFYRDNLAKLAGGDTIHGVRIHTTAILSAAKWKDAPALHVHIGNLRVGSIPLTDTPDLHSELLAICPNGRVSTKARISHGFEGGDYSVSLSLARPLRLRT